MNIVLHPNDILRARNLFVLKIDHNLITDMYTILDAYQGFGLAAPQVGHNSRLFIIDDHQGHRQTFINPRIISSYGDDIKFTEGCLSIPGIYKDIIRKSSLGLDYTTILGDQKQEAFHGLQARIIQHEMDHLDGRLIIDYT